MRVAVLVFPGSNCDRDMAIAFRNAGARVEMVWHRKTSLPAGTDIVGVPGGFSYGDYLRCGAIAARSPVCCALNVHVERGGYVLGVCNGFQVLTEMGVLPGALLRNAGQRYICRSERLNVVTLESVFTAAYGRDRRVVFPIAHRDGNYFADPEQIKRLQGEDRIAFTYVDNPNGSAGDIAGILSANRRVLGLMPHPERAAEPAHASVDGAALFSGLLSEAAVAKSAA